MKVKTNIKAGLTLAMVIIVTAANAESYDPFNMRALQEQQYRQQQQFNQQQLIRQQQEQNFILQQQQAEQQRQNWQDNQQINRPYFLDQ